MYKPGEKKYWTNRTVSHPEYLVSALSISFLLQQRCILFRPIMPNHVITLIERHVCASASLLVALATLLARWHSSGELSADRPSLCTHLQWSVRRSQPAHQWIHDVLRCVPVLFAMLVARSLSLSLSFSLKALQPIDSWSCAVLPANKWVEVGRKCLSALRPSGLWWFGRTT